MRKVFSSLMIILIAVLLTVGMAFAWTQSLYCPSNIGTGFDRSGTQFWCNAGMVTPTNAPHFTDYIDGGYKLPMTSGDILNCGANTSTCGQTDLGNATFKVVYGSANASTGGVVNLVSLPYTNSTTYFCVPSAGATATAINGVAANFTGAGNGTVVTYVCIGQ